MSEENRDVHVTIVGAGIAGLTAALHLAQRGYKVSLYEQKPYLGGNLGSQEDHGTYYDVFCHMFGTWYKNFWHLVEDDLGLERAAHFTPRTSLKYLQKGEFPQFTQLTNSGSLRDQAGNLFSGIEPPADMLLWSYALIDLLTQRFYPDDLLSRYSVNGFMASRPYATNGSAALQDAILMTIWSVHSDLTSAASYQDFIKYGFRHPTPTLWLLKGSSYDEIIKPLQTRLEQLGCEITTNVSITDVMLAQNKVERIRLCSKNGTPQDLPIDRLLLAVSPKTLGNLVMTGTAPQRITDHLPQLTELRRLQTEPIPVVTLYFTRTIPDIPTEPVALRGSRYDLSFTDISQAWGNDPRMKGRTVLCVAASDFYALPSFDPKEDGFAMLRELNGYLSFRLGKFWGDPDSDIDWDMSRSQSNSDNTLFINEVGSEEWRPKATYARIPNLFFAGDFCKTTINMATVEAAVMSGLKAAQALWRKAPLGKPIEIIEPDVYPESLILALKLFMAPYAYGAKAWSLASDVPSLMMKGELARSGANLQDMIGLPYAFALDWWKTLWALTQELLPKMKNP